jgi:two-component system response regulator
MHTKLILLVEDNPNDEVLMLRALRKNEITSQVFVVHDGVEALDYLFSTGEYAGANAQPLPHLILLDLKLPKVNGFEVLKGLRANPRTRYIPVVVLTSSIEDADIVNSYDLGANGFVQKPIDFNEFVGVAQQLGVFWLAANRTVPHQNT